MIGLGRRQERITTRLASSYTCSVKRVVEGVGASTLRFTSPHAASVSDNDSLMPFINCPKPLFTTP